MMGEKDQHRVLTAGPDEEEIRTGDADRAETPVTEQTRKRLFHPLLKTHHRNAEVTDKKYKNSLRLIGDLSPVP